MLPTLNQFCCGCSPALGVGVILFFHLAACLFYIVCACSNIIGLHPTFWSSWSAPSQLVATGYFLVGLPIIFAAAWGVYTRTEINIRIYLGYFLLSFVVDAAYLITVLANDVCDHAFLSVLNKEEFGSAFVCGTARTASYAVVAAFLVLQVYCIWTVWSLCEDIHSGKNGPELSELIPGKGRDPIIIRNKSIEDGPQSGIVGFAKSSLPGPYPSPYGAITTEGNTIFGGTTHETRYPPAQY